MNPPYFLLQTAFLQPIWGTTWHYPVARPAARGAWYDKNFRSSVLLNNPILGHYI